LEKAYFQLFPMEISMSLHSQNTNYVFPLNPEDTASQWHILLNHV